MNARRGVTFIFSTHDNMVMQYARRVVTIRDGRIALEATMDEVQERYGDAALVPARSLR